MVYLVEAKDLDEAVEIAARIPSSTYGSIEVRPVMNSRRRADARMPEGSPGSVEEVFKAEWGGLVATLIRHLGDFDLAKDSAEEAFAIAADRWRRDGIPSSPRAWLLTTARHRALDRIRRDRNLEAKKETLKFSRSRSKNPIVTSTMRSKTIACVSSSPVVIPRLP